MLSPTRTTGKSNSKVPDPESARDLRPYTTPTPLAKIWQQPKVCHPRNPFSCDACTHHLGLFAVQAVIVDSIQLWFQTIISKWLWRTSPEFAENDAQFSIMIAREKKNNTHPCTKSKSLIVIAAGAVHFMPIGSARGESGDNTRKLHGPAILSTPCVSMPSSAMVGQVTPNVDPHRIPCVRDQLYALVELSRCRGKHILTSVLPCLE